MSDTTDSKKTPATKPPTRRGLDVFPTHDDAEAERVVLRHHVEEGVAVRDLRMSLGTLLCDVFGAGDDGNPDVLGGTMMQLAAELEMLADATGEDRSPMSTSLRFMARRAEAAIELHRRIARARKGAPDAA